MKVEKVGREWVAYHPSGREVARSHDRALLDGYLTDLGSSAPAASDAAEMPLTETTYTTRARSTGATVSAGKTKAGWGSHCLNHGTLWPWKNRTEAEAKVSRPQEWCPPCTQIAEGNKPKITVKIDPTDLEDLL